MAASFPDHIVNAALASQAKYGVPASVTLAQWALESNYGSSAIAANNNNPFGIRNNSSRAGTQGANGWQLYDSITQAFDDHGKLLSTNLYTSAASGASDLAGYVKRISAVYAPASDGNLNYAGKLLDIISKNNLTQYDTVFAGSEIPLQPGISGGGSFTSSIFRGLAILAVVGFIFAFGYRAIGGKKHV